MVRAFEETVTAGVAGQRVYLRPVTASDANERYLSWLLDEEVTRYLELGYRENTLETLRDDIRRFNSDPGRIFRAIIAVEGDLHIGNIKIERIDKVHRFGELGLMIGDKRFWRRGYGTEAIRLMCNLAFEEYGLRRVTATYFADNVASQLAFQRLGFQVEGVYKGHRWSRHIKQWVDEFHVALVNPQAGMSLPRG